MAMVSVGKTVNVLIAPLWNWNTHSIRLSGLISVLIAPLWNWNSSISVVGLSSLSVLIAPLWNWNVESLEVLPLWMRSSNRTFMELKWRWRKAYRRAYRSSNRTFMELKFVMAYGYKLTAFRSNRTFMELKLKKIDFTLPEASRF